MIVFKDIRGSWAASREVEIAKDIVLRFYAAKRSTGLVACSVQGHRVERGNLVYTPKDFSYVAGSSNRPCTQKLVEALVYPEHEDKIIDAAKRHYLIGV